MSNAPLGPGYWQASDGNWYPLERHPSVGNPPPTDPPSGSKALVWTILAAFWLWFLLPVAVYYARQARREAEASDGRYAWSRSLLHRPMLLWLVVFASSMGLILAMALTGIYAD